MEVSGSGTTGSRKVSRRFWSAEQKQRIVAEAELAGADVAEVAKRHGVRPSLLSAWRRRSRVATTPKKPTKFAAVHVAVTSTEGVIEIDLAARCVRVRGIVDAQMLREVLAAAR